MNNNIKILLTINLEGGTLVRKNESETITWSKSLTKGKNLKKVVKRGSTKHYSKVSPDATQRIKITEEAYINMVSNSCPYNYKGNWKSLNRNMRLHYHLQLICNDLGGKDFSYEILTN